MRSAELQARSKAGAPFTKLLYVLCSCLKLTCCADLQAKAEALIPKLLPTLPYMLYSVCPSLLEI